MNWQNFLYMGVPSIILVAALVDDLKTRKIHNWLVLVCFAFATICVVLINGFSGLGDAFVASATALALTLPFVVLKAMGAGDMKIMLAFGMASQWQIVFWVIVYSFIWGAILGIIRALLDKNAVNLLTNTFFLATKKISATDSGMTKIPFSVALLFGWLTHLSLSRGPGEFLLW